MDVYTNLVQCVPCIIIYEDNNSLGVAAGPEQDPVMLIQRPAFLFPLDSSRTPGSQEEGTTGVKMQSPILEPSSQPPQFPVTTESFC